MSDSLRAALLNSKKPDKLHSKQPIEIELDEVLAIFAGELERIADEELSVLKANDFPVRREYEEFKWAIAWQRNFDAKTLKNEAARLRGSDE